MTYNYAHIKLRKLDVNVLSFYILGCPPYPANCPNECSTYDFNFCLVCDYSTCSGKSWSCVKIVRCIITSEKKLLKIASQSIINEIEFSKAVMI